MRNSEVQPGLFWLADIIAGVPGMDKHSAFIIVGAGPAGASLAVRLSRSGHKVLLIEKDRFPREKLCGEFISPECFRHFDELGVSERLLARGGDRIVETRFYSRGGRCVSVPTSWFGHGPFALSLSRAEMDLELLTAARRSGAEVVEGARVVSAAVAGGRIASVDIRLSDGERRSVTGDVFIDASGRGGALTRLASGAERRPSGPNGLVGIKAHLDKVRPEGGVCEIYFFNGGYGGLSHVEDGKANFCFLVTAKTARTFIGKTNDLFASVLDQNERAGYRMSSAVPVLDWLAVSVTEFGSKSPPAIENLIAVGDAGAFIDPFTGSGMLMALESSELLASCITRERLESFEPERSRLFRRRLFISGLLRRAAFIPAAASAAIAAAGASSHIRERLARSTRPYRRAV